MRKADFSVNAVEITPSIRAEISMVAADLGSRELFRVRQ
jgi:hypothetical protein